MTDKGLIFSPANLEELAGGDKGFLQDLWDSYTSEFHQSNKVLLEALHNRTTDSVLHSHNIKSGSSSLGALEMVEISKKIEEHCKEKRWDEALQMYPQLAVGFNRLTDIFTNWISNFE